MTSSPDTAANLAAFPRQPEMSVTEFSGTVAVFLSLMGTPGISDAEAEGLRATLDNICNLNPNTVNNYLSEQHRAAEAALADQSWIYNN